MGGDQQQRTSMRTRRGCRIDVDLGDMKNQFTAWCRANQLNESDAIRMLVAKAVGVSPVSAPRAHFELTNGGGRRRIEMRLTVDEYAALEMLSGRTGFPINRLLVAMIRAQATGEPEFAQNELAALSESNYQLAAIGRNLNQLVRAMNAEPARAGLPQRLAVIDGLRREIEAHLASVHAMLRSTLNRWRR